MRQRPELGQGGSECPRPPPKGLSLALGPSPLPSSAALLVELSVRTEIPYVSPFPIGKHVLSNPLILKLNNDIYMPNTYVHICTCMYVHIYVI